MLKNKRDIELRRGYSISKRLVKLTRFKSFPLKLSGYLDIPLLSFVRVASSTLIRCGWVFISRRSVENCITVEKLNTLNTDLQSLLQNIKNLQKDKQGLFSLIPEATVHINLAVILARSFRTPILYYIDNHIQNRCSKKSRKIPLLESLFNKAAGLRPAIILRIHFNTGVFLWVSKNF